MMLNYYPHNKLECVHQFKWGRKCCEEMVKLSLDILGSKMMTGNNQDNSRTKNDKTVKMVPMT